MTSVAQSDNGEQYELRYPNKDGTRIVVVTRWLDRQHVEPRWRSKHRTIKLKPGEIEYFLQRESA